MKLSEYVLKINGVPIGASRSLRNNLTRSIGAKNFPSFWKYWNPIFGYYLGKKIYKPLKKIFPTTVSLLFTFIFSGLIHDLITTLLRKKISLFFTIWFLIMSIAVIISKKTKYDLSHQNWTIKALVNFMIILFCLLLTIILNQFFHFY